jgi:hypothetical protein
MGNNESKPIITPYTSKQLALLYGVSKTTIVKWLKPFEKEIGERIGKIYNPRQVEVIFEKLGYPEKR